MVRESLNKTFREAEQVGTWADYAVHTMGDVKSGDDELDLAINRLYTANEDVHRLANKLALRYDVDFMEPVRPT
jgi:hypothetical protein